MHLNSIYKRPQRWIEIIAARELCTEALSLLGFVSGGLLIRSPRTALRPTLPCSPALAFVSETALRSLPMRPVEEGGKGACTHLQQQRPSRRMPRQHSREERKASARTKRGVLGQPIPTSCRSRWLRTDSCNHRFEPLMVHLSVGALRGTENRAIRVPQMHSHPSTCELGAV